MFWCFGHKAGGILVPRPGIKPAPPALDREVSNTGLPDKSHWGLFFSRISYVTVYLLSIPL